MATLLALIWVVAGTVIAVVGWFANAGKMPRQHWAGIRTRTTMASDSAWYAAHFAAGPWLLGGGALVAFMGVLLLIARPGLETVEVVSIVLAILLLAIVCGAGATGVHAAKKAQRA